MNDEKVKNKHSFNILDKIRNNKKLQYGIIIFFLIIIVVMFVFSSNTKQVSSENEYDYIQNYVNNLENKLSSCLSKVKGAGKVSVVITVESGMETVLAMSTTTKETSSGVETQTVPVVINGKTVVVKELYPKITGVLIVAEGANNLLVMSKLQNATMSLLDIDIEQIEILSM